ncbi:putative adrenodoxin-NADP(+) reductase, Biotin synthase [Helianthus annuus]|uniref:NADPH:adrenodoxin oxidoreductase, mitochondrial n=1 Tax=Helianthus annuus TaxID=4232 RepID=A0A251V3H1_HELAN|nr:NADPH:adrenodoxin oxidoreductase, mitochondrial isoform X1 [Helianthus annuus]XP_035843233.1 NADPH:adrenodoxin oxidoreductase, mitochondrial isoform X1 [Helianthus annuus]XP_035843234.1 NADPH:adrenodoxin oxidoreductase, mitochondrial isoform X1 [Helianthus annuus]XP_035843235.1 NADPH:adrenodoxin oxidoreductase, mitochondrial isoform X1 [Helianthus annuus]KAF5812617.1 putative adrenodoxin-NADP(+) reductase, Biotin synthase [Helianthus annuus]KAJ0606433.1 putative adrenodoxin-NADP(+) reductas
MGVFRAMIARTFSAATSRSLRVCVVGSGPAGFYTAEKMLKAHEEAEVDIIDRLPTPFGLVRSGVAPDHPETKIVINQFSRVAHNERCSFFGNVSLGSSVSLSELRQIYHVVVLAYGAESDRVLGIPGEDLSGVHSAREFVWWYNGHPDLSQLAPDLKNTDTAIVLGQGNVALDVARILLRPPAELATTDIASHALAALKESSIRKVYLVGRRGPVQAACTAKELREILAIKDLYVNIKQDDLQITSADEEEMKNSRIRRRVYDLLSKASSSSQTHPSSGQPELHFTFFRKPDKFLESSDKSGHVAGVKFEKTTLKASAGSGNQIAAGTGQYEDLKCGLVLKSIGYKSIPVDGLPFDHSKGVVPNIRGRVVSSSDVGQPVDGLYVCGWLKRGPTGIIATNLYDAEETVTSISEDIKKKDLTSEFASGREGLLQLLENRKIKVVTFNDWEKIDSEEKRLGSLMGKPREKLTNWKDLLAK